MRTYQCKMRLINVEVAAPRGLSRERDLVLVAIEEANQTFKDADLAVRLRLATADPEIIIGIFWWQFSIEAQELIQRGLHEWREHDKPYTIVFFNQKPYAPTTSQETQEWSRVLDLRRELSERGLAEAYLGDEDFVRKVGARLKCLARQIVINSGVVDFGVVASQSTTVPQVIPDAFTCTVMSTMPSIRAEGYTELLGEIGLMFSGGTPVSQGGSVHSLRLELFLNTVVTNRIDETGLSDAVLVRNDGFAGTREMRGRVYGNCITFDKVTVEAPGTDHTLSFSIRNIRANASVLSGGEAQPKVLGVLKVSPESTVTVTSSVQDLALIQPTLEFAVVKPEGVATGRKISDVFVQSFSADGETLGFLRFTGLQPFAFMPRAAESDGHDAEDSTGTRLKVEMHNLPTGVRVFVSVANCGHTEKARLITSELDVYRERPATDIFDEIPVAEVAIENGYANAVWEVIASDRRAGEVLDFAAFLSYDAHPEVNAPLPCCVAISGSFAPTPSDFRMSRWFGADIALPIPRFIGSREPATRWFLVEIQWTSLLFPFVCSQQGTDTHMVVSNVSADPMGMAPQAGAINLYFYGENAPDIVYTCAVPAGRVYVTRASLVAPGFIGYVIARCAFSPARGFAILTGCGFSSAATSYLAEVIDVGDNKRQRVQSPISIRRVSTLEVDSIAEDIGD